MEPFEEYVVDKYLTLRDALKLLPGVMPNKSKWLIDEAFEIIIGANFETIEPSYQVGGTILTPDERKELYIETENFYGTTVIRTSPKGAKVLLRLYYNGDLILKKGQKVVKETELQTYIDKETYFLEEADRIRREREHRQFLIENPDQIKEAEFCYSLLNTVLYRHRGPGDQSMILDGIEVEKIVTTYRSNSGKSKDSEVIIRWTGSDGTPHKLTKESMYSGNRRNDPDRNWGLPE